jgi:catechol 2,3-dioxygenase-like lactoylglutathione lyase family enzyme
MTEVIGLHHVQLAMPVGGEHKAVEFYEGLLGLPRVAKPEYLEARGGCWFRNESVEVHLGVEDDFRSARKAHPALVVDDLDELRESLVAAGVRVMEDEPLSGFARFYATDPFGNRIEFLEPI